MRLGLSAKVSDLPKPKCLTSLEQEKVPNWRHSSLYGTWLSLSPNVPKHHRTASGTPTLLYT
jgi:hypothetical protein